MDLFEAATEDLGDYAAIVPGDPEQSEVVRRLKSQDEYERMPPADSGKSLSEKDIQLLEAWISSGAVYEEHWAFVAPVKAVPPELEGDAWSRNPIDRFVLNRLGLEGLKPSPPALRSRLARRVYLDLIGLPPTPDELKWFLDDSRPDSYERLVERLLSSPHYGERWARRWLDLARYSDTKGYEKDQPRTMWHYRDWVINAFNEGMPFDQFTIEQIAGDMLPDATLSQLVATGFHRNTMTNEEGGIDPQEFRFLSVVDRVATTGATWLGLTTGCAQCHTHKFDPITHTEYFQLFALLNNADEPKIAIEDDATQRRRLKVEALVHGELESMASLLDSSPPPRSKSEGGGASPDTLGATYRDWKKSRILDEAKWLVVAPAEVETNLALTEILDDQSVLCSGDITKNDILTLSFKGLPPTITAIRLEAIPHESLPGGGPGRQQYSENNADEGNFYLSELEGWVDQGGFESGEPFKLQWAGGASSYSADAFPAELAVDGVPDTGWAINGGEGKPHAAVFRLESPIQIAADATLKLRFQHESFIAASLGRFRVSFTSEAGTLPPQAYPATVSSILRAGISELEASEERSLQHYYLRTQPGFETLQAKIAELEAGVPQPSSALVMSERAREDRRQTERRHRGEYLHRKETVAPGIPMVLSDPAAPIPKDRLEFARWLVSEENPLTARVVVNRHWEAFFGRGIVPTTADFGYQGEFPTHPELLDWLAVDFMEQEWSLKQLHRLIVTSATYQQSSSGNPASLEKDPENKLLARGSRFRMDAEMIRDTLLTASGLLNRSIGGPSVFPPQPPGITEAAFSPFAWVTSLDKNRYRRSLYTFSKRTAPYATFSLFDAPSGEVCVPRRNRSNTPLQSLALLNDRAVVEAARHMAAECLAKHGNNNAAIAGDMFERCVARKASSGELSDIVAFFDGQLVQLTDPAASSAVLATGPEKRWDSAEAFSQWSALNECETSTVGDELSVKCTGSTPRLVVDAPSSAGRHTLVMRARFDTTAVAGVSLSAEEEASPTNGATAEFHVVPEEWRDYSVEFDADEDFQSLTLHLGQRPSRVEIASIRLFRGDGLFEVSQNLDVNRLAAWMLTARGLLNLDETITKP